MDSNVLFFALGIIFSYIMLFCHFILLRPKKDQPKKKAKAVKRDEEMSVIAMTEEREEEVLENLRSS